MNRTEQIKGYLKRLGDGESLENVKKDFVKEFNDVNPIEIMEAEQALIAEGTPISEVSKLCDVHSALFHGATKEERIAKAENEISEMKKYYDDTMKGMTKSAIADMRKDRESIFNGKLIERIENVIKRAEEMIYKEDNILYPNCAANFTEAEWIGIYHDSKDYAVCLDTVSDRWEKAEEVENVYKPEVSEQSDKKEDVQNELYMAGGHMTLSQLEALLNAIPMEITFVDEDNINRYFNEGSKVFKRPVMAIDREVFSCHPPKIEAKVRRIIEEFRIGTLDEVSVWMDKQGRTMLVKYIAVRDKQGNYVGTLEAVQDMEFAKEHFAKLK